LYKTNVNAKKINKHRTYTNLKKVIHSFIHLLHEHKQYMEQYIELSE